MTMVLPTWLMVLTSSLGQWSGSERQVSLELGLEGRQFFQDGRFGNPDRSEWNLRLQPQFTLSWDRSRKVIQFSPYGLVSQPDDEKSHFDIREASFLGSFGAFELRAGISTVFWGVTESVHLVDIINQTDLVENVDGEDKLGQPMVALTYVTNLGDFSLFALPYFRERTFAGTKGRLRTPIVVDVDNPVYQSSREESHLDWAFRWEDSFSAWDLGLGHFTGTSRDPILLSTSKEREPALVPHYYQIDQSGLDVQFTSGPLLLKHESVFRQYRDERIEDFYGQATGLEFTLYAIGATGADLGLILEVISVTQADNSLTPFHNHMFSGVRVSGNDLQGSEILAGVVFDLESSNHFASLEAKRRLSTSLSARLEVRYFHSPEGGLLHLNSESHIQLECSYLF